MDGVRGVVLDAGRAITPLLADERVAARWAEPSALALLSVGGLAGHLVRALETIETYLDEPEPPDDGLVSPSEYWLVALRAAGDLQSPMHTGVRQRGEEAAAAGPVALVEEHRARLERLAARFDTEPPTRRVLVVRGTVRMRLDDYLPTRLVEIAVHADDLATSVGAALPELGDVLAIAIDVLVGTAVLGHGPLAVLRALTRRERDDVEALRVL